jgi:outer membrane protein TolC
MDRVSRGFRWRRCRLWTLTAVLSAFPGSRSAAEIERLTLDRALELAFQGSRTLEISTLEVTKAEQRLVAARTHRYPVLQVDLQGSKPLESIEFGFERGVFGEFPGIGPIPASDTQVTSSTDFTWFLNATLAQPLTGQYRIGLGVRFAELDVDLQRERSRGERQALASRVREAYVAVLQAESARTAADEALGFLRELERVVADQVERETALRLDLLDVRSRLAGSEYQVRVARHAVDSAKEQLNLLLGREVATPFEVQFLPPPGPLETDLEQAVARALGARPDLSEARLQVRLAELDRRSKRAEHIPDLNLVLSNYSFNVEFLPRDVQTAGLALSWEPFDWGRRRRETAEKAVALKQSERAAAEAEAAARVEVGALYRGLDDSRALVDVREAERSAAKEKARVLANRYQAQAALLKDVLQAQSDLAQAEDGWRQAVLAFWTARAGFLRAVGEE